MVLQSTGPITLGNIASEFFLSAANVSLAASRAYDFRLPQAGAANASAFYSRCYLPLGNAAGNIVLAIDHLTTNPTGNVWLDYFNRANLTTVNGPVWSSPSYISYGLGTQYATLPSISGVTDFTSANAYSVCFWFWPELLQFNTQNTDNDVMEKWASGTAYPYVFRWMRASQSIGTAAYGNSGAVNPAYYSSPYTTPVNCWNHVVGVFDWPTTKKIYLYINGILSGNTSPVTISGINNATPLQIARRGSAINYFTGRIGGIYIYNRALSATEVSNLYQTGTYRTMPSYYEFPSAALTANSTTVSGPPYGNGVYVANASSVYQSNSVYYGFRAFDKTGGNYWHAATSSYDAQGSYTGTYDLTSSGYKGEWLSIVLPTPIALAKYKLLGRTSFTIRSPNTWRIYGSNNGSSWFVVDSQFNITGWADNTPKEFTISAPSSAFTRFGLVVANIANTGAANPVNLAEFQLYSLR